MHRFFVYTNLTRPGLHVWREGTSIKHDLRPVDATTGPGWVEFQCNLSETLTQPVRFMLFSFNDQDKPVDFENDVFQRELPRLPSGKFPPSVWCASGNSRVVLSDPRHATQTSLRIHLISQSRFRPAEMYLWDPATGAGRRTAQSSLDALGPVFDIDLAPHERSFFNFKFIRQDERQQFTVFEPDVANRWFVADDGAEIWIHSGTASIAHQVPETRTLTLHYRQEFAGRAQLHLSADNGDYVTDVDGTEDVEGWTTFATEVFTQLPYSCRFRNPGIADEWEHPEAKRSGITLTTDTEFWTLEGDNELFEVRPEPNLKLELTVANTALSNLEGNLFAHVWVNRARGPLVSDVPVSANGEVSLQIYPRVTTSIKFHDDHRRWERFRHAIEVDAAAPVKRYVVLERPPLLAALPVTNLVMDPPFQIRRPGAYVEGDELRFVVHTPHAADVKIIGEWTSWMDRPLQMHSTRDGTYWWGTVKLSELLAGLGDGRTDYHGVKYQFLFNQINRLQDPAAGWVENSRTNAASRLVNHNRFDWQHQAWDRPTPDYYVIYQLHPSRFTNRFTDEPPLRRIAREIDDQAGYFRELGVTAIQLLPINEVSSKNSWGYDPAYFYAVERDYCGSDGPDDLKHLVHTCHKHGLAVVLDVVFNHAGGDNILWEVARDSFFDGDTQWGALVNFDHPQCLHFFAQNLVYLANEFRIDAFRLDHTATIVHSGAWNHPWSGSVRQLGSGGGWEFLHGLRHAVRTQVSGHCLLMAEHLPNEWSVTNYGGPMDAQWGDDFHDRLIDACRRQYGMSRLADAMKLTHTTCDDWYKIVNYPESHDEVGNVRDRVAYVAGYGQGWRMSKVAAAATLLSRGIPLYFMGAESGEDKQFGFGSVETLDLKEYLANNDRSRIRRWWRELGKLRRDPSIKGPAPLEVRFAEEQILTFSRGQNGDYFVVLNFGGWSGHKSLAELNLPWGEYRELWNSTWPAFAIQAEQEGEHTNGGRDARLHRGHSLHIPDYGVTILQRL